MSTRNPNPRRRIAGERRPRPPRDVTAPATGSDPGAGSWSEPAVGTSTRPLEERAWQAPEPYVPPSGDAEDAGADDFAHARGAGSGGPSWLLVTALGVLTLVLALVAGLLASPWGWDLAAVRRHDAVQEASSTAPPAAERAAAAILSYSYKSLSADERAAERYMTPRYRKDYEDAFAKLVRPNAGKLHARVRAVVKGSGVSHADPDRVEVLVYVDQTTLSTANGGQPQVALNRAMFTMQRSQRSGGDWLVDKITSY
jgi:Mce-associated membrane protein